jgi:N-acetyl-alpha-D-glucosaminyl L-malate synthase BshA
MAARPLRIGITSFATIGGSGIVATELGVNLAQRGCEVHFISNAVPARLTTFAPNIYFHEVEVVTYTPFPHTPYSLALATKMTEVARYHELDLLHVHYAIPHAASSFLAQQMLLPRRIATVTTLHGTDITLVGQVPSFYALTKFVIERSDAVTAVSRFLEVETRRIFDIRRPIGVIPNFVDTETFTPRPELKTQCPFADAGQKVLMHVSNLRPVKNLPTVLRVFSRVRQQVPCKLVIVGDGPERGPSESLARQLGVARDVVFTGNQELIHEILAMADVLLLPSEHESFGLVALEAMSCQTPVVASNRGGLPEVIESGSTGFLHDPHDEDGQVASVLRLLREPDLAMAMGQRARAAAIERFDLRHVIDAYVRLYDELLDGGVPPRAA